MKKYLFENASITIIVKAPNEFMAACYANQYMEKRYLARFETSDAIELDNDMDFGVIAAIDRRLEDLNYDLKKELRLSGNGR